MGTVAVGREVVDVEDTRTRAAAEGTTPMVTATTPTLAGTMEEEATIKARARGAVVGVVGVVVMAAKSTISGGV